MKDRISLFLVAVFIFSASISFTQHTAAETIAYSPITMPYVAEITGTDVYVRSGPGEAYYYCSKLNSPAKVTVVDRKFHWLKIVPPEGSFSWISKAYVKLDTDNPGIGIVKEDSVRVWAGSDYVGPMNSHSLQQKLYKGDGTNEGDTVKLMDEVEGDYYKIYPPSNSYLWVHEQYTKYHGLVPEPEPMVLPPKPTVKDDTVEAVAEVVEVKETEEVVAVVEGQTSTEVTQLARYYELAKQVDAELTKAVDGQNYTEIKKSLEEILNDADAGKASRYAQYQLDRIGRFELAREVAEQVKNQDAKLAWVRNQIRKARSARLAEIPDLGKFVISGIIKPSYIYTSKVDKKRYLVLDRKGKVVSYAIAANSLVAAEMNSLVNKEVGLIGEVVTDSYSPIGLVKVSKVLRLKPANSSVE